MPEKTGTHRGTSAASPQFSALTVAASSLPHSLRAQSRCRSLYLTSQDSFFLFWPDHSLFTPEPLSGYLSSVAEFTRRVPRPIRPPAPLPPRGQHLSRRTIYTNNSLYQKFQTRSLPLALSLHDLGASAARSTEHTLKFRKCMLSRSNYLAA